MTPTGGEQKRAKRKPSETAEADIEAPPKKESKSTEDLDKLIDEIDEVLEENAEEFVRSYVQKGGEARPSAVTRHGESYQRFARKPTGDPWW